MILVVLGVCAGAFVLAGASDKGPEGQTYTIMFDNAFGLTNGGDFRVGGVNAGQTTDFAVEKKRGEAPKAIVTAEITKPGFGQFRSDASCEIRPQSLIGEYYVDCQPGQSDERLPHNTVPVEQTSSTIPTDIVNDIMRRPYRERFRLLITELGTGLAGRPDDLQEVLRRAHPGLRETSRVLRILGDQNEVIKNFITDSDTVVQELEKNKRDVVRWVQEAGDAAEISATRRNELRAQFRRFPEFLDELRPTMARLGQLADEQTPLLADLRQAAPDLDTFFTRLGPFAEASRPAVKSLGEMGEVGTKAFREGKQEIAELRRLAINAPPFAKPLRQFLQTIDDRERAIENDPRAKETAPPAPDPTAIPAEGAAGPEDVRALQLLSRPEPARHLQPRPARRRLEPGGGAGARRERPARHPDRRAARRGHARGGPAARPARPLEAADRAAPPRAGSARRPDPAPAAQAGPGRPAHEPGRAAAGARADRAERTACRQPDHRPASRLLARAMRRRRGQGNLAASPVLIGATTVLIAIVAVFIAYNANSGLPFVPTYDLEAELPSGGKLVKGNEVRVGGFRVGVVEDVRPEVRIVNGERRAIALAELSLDKKVEPLARD